MHLDKNGKDILRDLKRYISELAEVEEIDLKGPASELARFYIEVREFYDQLHDVSTPLTDLKNKMAYQDIPAAFEREGTSTLTIKEGYRVTVSALVRASCKKMDDAIVWMKRCECGHPEVDHGNGINTTLGCGQCGECQEYNAPNAALVKETINAQTLAAFVRSEMQEGREVPEDVFTVSIGQNTSVTKVS